jgi:tRNA A-37 threonylcarbamoyl transferase component Bud32
MQLILLMRVVAMLGLVAGLCLVAFARRPRRLRTNPRYRELLRNLNLTDVEAFLALPSIIISGHPNRNVARVTLGSGPDAVSGYLKREHHVLLRDYVSSAVAGFGFLSRSRREAQMLEELKVAGIACPEVIAVGEDGRGRAFLLVRAVSEAIELRDLLRSRRISQPEERRGLGRRLGQALARLHSAGFFHADLNSTHVLVQPQNGAVAFLDWQRSTWHPRLKWGQRCRDLAALDATLASEVAAPRERLGCLREYLRAAGMSPHLFRRLLVHIRRRSRRLLGKRYVRELRDAPLRLGEQNLIWLDGEAICVTPEFQAQLDGKVPYWLLPVAPHARLRNWSSRQKVPLAGARAGFLSQRTRDLPFAWLLTKLRGRPFTSPELRQAATLFRLQRYGVTTPRLLAVGQRPIWPWQSESFLLTEAEDGLVPLTDWLARHTSLTLKSTALRQFRLTLGKVGHVLRRLHEAGCYLDGRLPFDVRPDGTLVCNAEELRAVRRPDRGLARNDLDSLRRRLLNVLPTRTDGLRFLRAYQQKSEVRDQKSARQEPLTSDL